MKDYETLEYQDSKEILNSTILGFFIGLAVIVPGISGSTMAIIFKLYDKLLYAIGNILKKFKLRALSIGISIILLFLRALKGSLLI